MDMPIEPEAMVEPAFDTEAARWQAVLARDPAADGHFVYAVRTTGVYCRPSCPSRAARRENVRFFTLHAEAEAAGFRPCRRCRPDQPSVTQRHVLAVEQACRRIEAAEGPVRLEVLASEAGLSPHHFHRIFRRITGVTPKAYETAVRARRTAAGLREATSVTEAIYAGGYAAPSRFYAQAGGLLGMTPRAWRAGGRGVRIRHAVAQSWLGPVLVAATDRGVCAIRFGEDAETLVAGLRASFPQAELVAGDPAFAALVSEVVARIAAPGQAFDLPLDIQGTAFQQRVWAALRAIPPGNTATYAEIAARIGQPGAARAVGRACGANPVAVAIPCHRAVRGDGGLGGYRWGLARKRRLLEREKAR